MQLCWEGQSSTSAIRYRAVSTGNRDRGRPPGTSQSVSFTQTRTQTREVQVCLLGISSSVVTTRVGFGRVGEPALCAERIQAQAKERGRGGASRPPAESNNLAPLAKSGLRAGAEGVGRGGRKPLCLLQVETGPAVSDAGSVSPHTRAPLRAVTLPGAGCCQKAGPWRASCCHGGLGSICWFLSTINLLAQKFPRGAFSVGLQKLKGKLVSRPEAGSLTLGVSGVLAHSLSVPQHLLTGSPRCDSHTTHFTHLQCTTQ